MTVQGLGTREFQEYGKVTAVLGGVVALIVIASVFAALLGGLIWVGVAVITGLVA